MIFELINYVNNWNSISKLKIYNPIVKNNNNMPKYHWKSVQNLFNKWYSISKLKIYNSIVKNNNNMPKYHWKSFQNLFNKW